MAFNKPIQLSCKIITILVFIGTGTIILSGRRQPNLSSSTISWNQSYSNSNMNRALSQNRTTFVTALYDIGRRQQGRPVNQYLRWLNETLRLHCSFIIFTSSSLAKEIRHMRSGELAAEIVLIERDHIPMQEFADIIERDIFPKFRSRMKYPKDITNVNKLYSIINHAKMIWLTEAIALNPFSTSTFFWIDAGFSRFIPTVYYTKHFPPSTKKIRMLASSERAFLAIASATDEEMNLSIDLPLKRVVGSNKNFIRGNFWGGHGDAVRKIAAQTLAIFYEMIAQDIIDNEQISLFLAYRKQPKLFDVHRTSSEAQSFNYIAEE